MGVTNNLIEVAVGSVSNRGNVDTLDKLEEYLQPETEVFRSMFLYDESFNGYIKEYEGTYEIDKIILDVDVKDEDLTNVRALYSYILDEVESAYTDIWFSGTGFHIYVADLFKLGPRKDLPNIMKLTLKNKFKNYDIDVIYDRSRLIRAEYSYNTKNNTYKIPITEEELFNFNYPYFVSKAKVDPREHGKLEVRYPYSFDPYWKDDIIYVENKDPIKPAQKPNGTHQYTSHVTCVQKMFKQGPIPGERHQTVLRMVSAWKRNGVTQEGAKALIGVWDPSFNVGEEVDRILDTVYSWEHTGYSCNDNIMEEHCDSICKFYKAKDYTIEVHNASTMSDDFSEFVKRDYEDKSFDLNDIYNIGFSYKFTVGELVTMIGDTKLGKTAFIQNLVAKTHQFKCLYLSLEVNQKLMWRRFCQIAFGATKQKVTEYYAKDNTKFIQDAKDKLGHIKILTVSPELNNILDVITTLQPTVIVIDTIDEIRVDYSNDPLVKTQKIVSKLKEIAQQYDVMIFAISHISKSAAFDGTLTRHSAKGDSSIEQKSDKLLGIQAPNPESKARVIESIVARDESGFKLRCYFNHETFQFVQAE
jgi:archaellum biogenesis ATPase FlaH